MTAQDIAAHLQLQDFKPLDDLHEVMAYDNRNSYALDAEGQVIGLNLRANALTDAFWTRLAGCNSLRVLNLSENKFSDLAVPAAWQDLQELNLSLNEGLSRVELPDQAAALQRLDLRSCSLERFHFPAGLDALKWVELQKNGLKKVTFEAACPQLEFLDLSENALTEASFPDGFEGLKYLYLMRNQLEQLQVEGEMPLLDTLHLRSNKFTELPLGFLEPFPKLVSLYLAENPLPMDLRSFINGDSLNCLDITKRYFREMEKGAVLDRECKVLLIGNGSAGKSCFVERLVHKRFQSEWNSTHAIVLEQHEQGEYLLNIWDFAGQDIYHATHRLFMQSDAVYLLFWDWETYTRPETIWKPGTPEERAYENRDLSYWMDYAISQGKKSPVILVQTKVGRPPHVKELPEIREKYQGTKDLFLEFHHIESEKEDWDENGYEKLLVDVRRAVKRIKSRNKIAKSYDQLRQAMREQILSGKKQMSVDEYLDLEAAKAVEDPLEVLENWLVKTGVVYYRSGLFNSAIILDQEWIIMAIYALFDRDKTFYNIYHNKGAFSGQDLIKYAWTTESDEERKLYIGFMLECEMCFETTPEQENRYSIPFTERSFVAPQLLDEQIPGRLLRRWEKGNTLYFRYEDRFFHYGIIQSFIVRTQEFAVQDGIWKNGIALEYKGQDALVEASEKEILVRVDRDSLDLLDRIRILIEDLQDEPGLQSVSVDGRKFVTLQELENKPEGNTQVRTTDGDWVEFAPFEAFLNRNAEGRLKLEKGGRGFGGLEDLGSHHFERKSLGETKELAIGKRAALYAEYYKSSDPEQKLSLKAKIAELDNEINGLNEKINQLGKF